jgi:hypothetical protein
VTAADISILRARACDVMAALGDVLDAITVIAQTVDNPGEARLDAGVIAHQLDVAHEATGEVCNAAHTLALGIEIARQLHADERRDRKKGRR